MQPESLQGEEPVLIAGAGPVGIATALFLARWGLPTVVLEAQRRRDFVGSKAICFQRDVLDVCDRIGVGEAMAAEGTVWTTARTYYRDHELFAATFPEPGKSVFPPWINMSQSSVEQHLFDGAARQPLVHLRFEHEVVALRQYATGVEVDAETPGGPRTLRGTHLIGADGSRGQVRHLLGLDFPGRSFADRFLIADIRAKLPFPNERRFFFDPPWNPGRQVLVHQQPESVWRIDWQVPDDFDLERERATGELDARIRRIVGDEPYDLVWLTVYSFHERVASAFRAGRIFLAGDAAHLFAPFGARGLNSGFCDAENLAWKLAFARRGWVTGEAAETLLASYDSERRGAALENLRVTGETMEFLVPQTAEQWQWRRDVLNRAVTDPGARRWIDSGKLAEPYWYLESPLTTPAGDTTDFPAAPGVARPPVPGVLCPDGPCEVAEAEPGPEDRPARPDAGPGPGRGTGQGRTRLRRLFGSGYVVLTAPRRVTQAQQVAAAAVSAPVTVYGLADIDMEGVLADALQAGPDSAHVVRPDGHLAAVLPAFDAGALWTALRRAAGAAPPLRS